MNGGVFHCWGLPYYPVQKYLVIGLPKVLCIWVNFDAVSCTKWFFPLAGYQKDNMTVHYPADFVKAYWILMSSGVLVVLMGLGFYIHSKTSKGVKLTDHIQANSIKTFQQQFSFKSCSPTKPLLAALLLLTLFIHIGCIFPLGRVYSKIIFSYDRDGPGLSVAKSSLMTSVFFISSLGGIVIFTIPATFIHVKYLLQVRGS